MDSADQHKAIPVFCSHRGVDKPAVRAFAARLRQAGIDAWFDQWEIQPGDSIVAKINEGLNACEVGLVFFSSKEHLGRWFSAEEEALTFGMIENGKRLIPVMIDADAPLPPLLSARARRGIDEFDAIVDAIRGTTSRPPLAPPPATAICHRIEIELRPATPAGTLDLIARENGAPIAQLGGLMLPPEALQNFAQFLHGGYSTAFRGPREAAALSLGEALARLGQQLGAVLFAGQIGTHLALQLDTLAIGDELQLVFASADATLLGLPFEAARLPDGRVPALLPAVSMLRRVIDAPEPAHPPQAGPLKILVAVGAPDEGQTRSAVLDLEAELQRILDAVGVASRHGNTQVKILEVGHPDEIRKALAADAFHVLHLSCHGSPGSVELEDEDGKAITVSAGQLATALRDAHQPLPLVFLATCHGGSPAGETASFAQALVQNGIPQVLAMQTRVSDDYATQLAAAFYGALGTPERPTASRALALARRELEARRTQASRPTPPEYATSSLFSAGLEQPLLDRRLDQHALSQPPVHQAGSLAVPQLKLGDLIGRRVELRRTLRILRGHPATVAALGERAGVVLQGMGGVGKSSLAGRVMARLTEEGWLCVALSGPFDIGGLADAIAGAGRDSRREDWKALAAALNPSTDDKHRIGIICTALAQLKLLIVLDNFEDNLEPDPAGARFRQAFHHEVLTQLCRAARCGRLLLTSRYTPADLSPWLETLPLGALSDAQTRKLVLRLPGLLAQLEADDGNAPLTGALQTLLLRVGGHPRMLEYLDAVLHNGRARLPDVTARLKRQAQALGVDVSTPPADLDEALALTLQLGTRDVLLDTLLTLADDYGDRPTLLQAAASNLPISVAGVAHALHDAEPCRTLVATTLKALERLSDLSLLSFVSEQEVFVHRWTAEVLLTPGATRSADTRNAILTRAGHYRLWRVEHETHALGDAVEATRNLLAGQAVDAASDIAGSICDFLIQANQLASAGSFAGEVCTTLPPTHPGFAALADTEASALLALGYTDAALARYRQLLAHHQRLAQAEPQRADYQRDLSVSYNKLGDLMKALGQGEAARDYHLKALDIAQRLAQAEPQRADYQRDLSISYNKLGDLMTALGQGEEARDFFLKALAIRQRLAQAKPQRADYQRDLSVSYERLGDLMTALGKGDEARDYFLKALDISQRLAQAEPQRADYQRDLSISYNNLGDLMTALGQGEAARDYFLKDLDIAQRLAQAEPQRADYQRDLSVSCIKLGDLMTALGKGDEARDYFLKALDIAQRLAQAEPQRADYQRDLSISYIKLGDLMTALGKGEEARDYFLKALDIAQRLAQAEPQRADYQRDLSVSCIKLGGLMTALGKGDEARDYFLKALDIAQRLAQAEPQRADYQRDLSVSCIKLGDLMTALGKGDEARDYFLKALNIAQRLAQAEPQRADYQHDLSVSYERLGDLMTALGKGEEARDYFLKDLDIAQRLAQAEPQRADYQRDLSVSCIKLGGLMTALGKGDEARDYFLKALDIAQRLAQAEPQRADYQRDLIVSHVKLAENNRAEAASHLEKALALAQRLKASGQTVQGLDWMVGDLADRLARAQRDSGADGANGNLD